MATPVSVGQPRGSGFPAATNGFSHHHRQNPDAGPSSQQHHQPQNQQSQNQQQPQQSVGNSQGGAGGGTTQTSRDVNEVLQTELGLNALLSKLRESAISARDFAGFLKKRAQIEEDHAAGLKKLCRVTHDTIHREPGPRRGTLMKGLQESNRIHDNLADNGVAFAAALNAMSEELTELSNNIEAGRKQWKNVVANSEKKGPTSYHEMEKARNKVDIAAKEYENARNGTRSRSLLSGGRHPEEDSRKKLEVADMEYMRQVELTNKIHSELFHVERPQSVKALRDLILECDAGLSLQLQKFVALNESFALNNGRAVSGNGGESDLRKALLSVDDEADMNGFIMEFASKSPPQQVGMMKFEVQKHPIFPLPPIQQSQPEPQPSTQPPHPHPGPGDRAVSGTYQNPNNPLGGGAKITPRPVRRPVKPVFGVPLEVLLQRDGNAVPIVVIQCMTAVELYGLNVEGIYRQAGATSHIQKIKEIFDNDSSKVDFRNPDQFFHDVNSVASALKQFFRELPDPVLTYGLYEEFIESAKIDDDNARRDSLHALINRLPDAHYATVRALVLHLSRVMQYSGQNKMNAWNLSICFGPTLMSARQEDLKNTNWQHRALDTILRNALDIFDDD
ncbi:uncharacterized protein DFL_001137 [Arthrobotrys flagrans]|uniref:Rho-GAP domain-containing protein n=1 Tax=Arthrobotrys flagrans TaxID=97331 RepID=A0A437AGB0_ARTFL|nr:hypothetical protein DFL_001137 [Arthrobotrys flagrans]